MKELQESPLSGVFAPILQKKHQEEVYKIWKSIKKQKMDKLIQLISNYENNSLLDQLKGLLSKSAKELDAKNIEFILKIWLILCFDDSNEDIYQFLQEMSAIIKLKIILFNNENELFESESEEDYQEIFFLFYNEKERKYIIKEGVDKKWLKKFKKIDSNRKFCVKCTNLSNIDDNNGIIYEICRHYFCEKCIGNHSNEKLCSFCKDIIDDDKLLCLNCRIPYDKEVLIEPNKERICQACYLFKNNL